LRPAAPAVTIPPGPASERPAAGIEGIDMPDEEKQPEAAALPCSPGYQRCPSCAEEIPGNAGKCPKCGELVGERAPGEGPVYGAEPTWFEQQFINTSTIALALVAFFLSLPALIVAAVALGVCKHPAARKKALTFLLLSGIFTLVALPVLLRRLGVF
jgi:hypothetical protein